MPGQLALVAGVGWQGWRSLDDAPDPALPLAALLTRVDARRFSWRRPGATASSAKRVCACDARNTVDPLTGLSTPLILYDRVRAVRNLIKRYGHPSVLLLVHIENLARAVG